ncbi:MAG TPA: DUF3048 domain-containing protein [Aeromicrobium sp.]|nr:DUF3048 domain-containing protein [Aeromicrobium sp.]
MNPRPLATAFAALVLLAGCSNGGGLTGEGSTTPPLDSNVSPLTGLKQDGAPDNPVYMVKIENTAGGEPQYGLNHADLVVEEFVEFDVTRLAAFFYSDLPTKVGHVRSTRTTDVGLAKPVDATLVASGGDDEPLKAVHDAGIKIYTYDMDDPGWSKDPNKVAPYHVLWNLRTLNETAKKTTPTRSYFEFGHGLTRADVTKTVTSAKVAFAPATITNWTYDGATWVRSPERSAAGENFKADTMVVLLGRVKDAGYGAQGGAFVPEIVLEGSGPAVIFSGNTATAATWHKQGKDGTMSFTARKTGKHIGLKPGRVWLEAAPRDAKVTY